MCKFLSCISNGDKNSGHCNSGNMNSGEGNSGNGNSGHWNSGHWNSGKGNSGDRNSGDRNSGDRNSGDRNSGNCNSGDRNSGHWNSGYCNSGYFNTNMPPIRIFNRETKKTYIDFPDWFYFDFNKWVPVSDMTQQEKEKIGWYKTTGGYLKKQTYREAWKDAFDGASKEEIQQATELPNFDYGIFEEITGISKKKILARLN
ncbi:MAG: hypothetical protein U9O94_08320 [Nanoarchaeota archaeon]|nr:hypothetical protein [Nanoarchaeota archaeon]